MICGHEREAVVEALGYAESDPEDSAHLAQWQGPCDEDDKCFGQWKATQSIHDPATLASIIAELLRERGLVVATDPCADVPWLVFADGNGDGVAVVAPMFAKTITISHARAFALRLLDAPATDIEQMIGEIR
jgi:hypothetical protein